MKKQPEKRICKVRSLQPLYLNLPVSLCVDGDASLQSDKPLHSLPGPAAQHLL